MHSNKTDKDWINYGKHYPYYGVVTNKKYLNNDLSKQEIENFIKGGIPFVTKIFNEIYSELDAGFKPNTILDFGCGVGRLTIPFSKYAKEIVGVDISPEMIEIAEQNCKTFDVNNAVFKLSDNNLSKIENQSFDLIYSYIVFQHIAPKRGEKIIERLIDKLNPNGIAVLHLTYFNEISNSLKFINLFRYRIPIVHYLLNKIKAKPANLPLMQMNEYNLNNIFYILQKKGISKMHVSFTNHGNYLGLILKFQKDKAN